jgi:hypothetical protein
MALYSAFAHALPPADEAIRPSPTWSGPEIQIADGAAHRASTDRLAPRAAAACSCEI